MHFQMNGIICVYSACRFLLRWQDSKNSESDVLYGPFIQPALGVGFKKHSDKLTFQIESLSVLALIKIIKIFY